MEAEETPAATTSKAKSANKSAEETEEAKKKKEESKKRLSRKSCAYKKTYNAYLEIHGEEEARKRARMAHCMQLAFFHFLNVHHGSMRVHIKS